MPADVTGPARILLLACFAIVPVSPLLETRPWL